MHSAGAQKDWNEKPDRFSRARPNLNLKSPQKCTKISVKVVLLFITEPGQTDIIKKNISHIFFKLIHYLNSERFFMLNV